MFLKCIKLFQRGHWVFERGEKRKLGKNYEQFDGVAVCEYVEENTHFKLQLNTSYQFQYIFIRLNCIAFEGILNKGIKKRNRYLKEIITQHNIALYCWKEPKTFRLVQSKEH